MPSTVWMVPIVEGDAPDAVRRKAGVAWDAAGLSRLIRPADLVALKVHFGEEGNHNFVRPHLLVPLVERVKAAGGKPFWTDTNTLYVGARSNAVDHIALAHAHGFTLEDTGAPVIIADGLTGREEIRVRVDGRHSAEVGIAPAAAACNALVAVSHATGHVVTGFGGALKNLGMGLSSRKGKLYQHSVVKPKVHAASCTACGTCLAWCPVHAISIVGDSALIDPKTCIGCGECLTACRIGAVRFQWRMASAGLQERMAEQAAGVVRHLSGRIAFMTFVTDVGKDCDCMASRPRDVLVKAAGILVSYDPVAIDQAALDLVASHLGRPLTEVGHAIDPTPQLDAAAALGIGSRDYDLVRT
ncbi:MAG: DUF362 domain-containing protein [Deltaproteobacteria bacterium]|nr:DUF362 domain-containing protein [Deltaproteobacteria bacterium]